VDQRFARLEERIDLNGRRLDVGFEQLRSEIALAMDERLTRFIASNARDHAHFDRVLAEHEARLKDLEDSR
jgi:hypothetical protein